MIEEYEIRAHVLKGVALSYKYNEYLITVAWGGSEMKTSSKPLEMKKCEWYEKLPKRLLN